MVKIYIKLFFLGTIIILGSTKIWCVEDTFIYFAVQKGEQDSSSNSFGALQKDTYLPSLEKNHGSLKENRKVNPTVFSFDFYKINGDFASGFGIELHNYKKIFSFENDSSALSLSAVGMLYGLNFYYRGDYWFPFIGFGTGNYSAKLKEELRTESSSTNATVFDQVDKPFYYKFGVRIPFNGFGLLISQNYISANMHVNSENKHLPLGGKGTFLGIFFSL